MATFSQRSSMHAPTTTTNGQDRPSSDAENGKRDMWSSMLHGVASGKRLPEKNLLILGGTSESQREFLDSLSADTSLRKGAERQKRKQPPLANNFALGYTYYDVLDADHEDILARLSLYLLADPTPALIPLLKPLLTPHAISNTLIVILLDWSEPWSWLKNLKAWVRLLRTLLVSLDEDCKITMEEVMMNWRDRGRGSASLDGTRPSVAASDGNITLPLGPGEWEDALGLPLCVVCQNSDRMEALEKERAWKEDEFDFVLQFLRTVLLKHGASLIYTTPSVASSLQTLIHASLGIQSLLKKQPLKHNVIDRDKVLVPPNWDSWGKIRVLREGFDVEGISNAWSVDIEEGSSSEDNRSHVNDQSAKAVPGAVSIYESTIADPTLDMLGAQANDVDKQNADIESIDGQAFLANQLELLNRLRQGGNPSGTDRRLESASASSQKDSEHSGDRAAIMDGPLNEHIGPVQFNMGGIQVDADDMLQRLKDRHGLDNVETSNPAIASPDGKSENEALASFFAGLMNRNGGATSSSLKQS